jgi:hypothetical protein
LLEEDKLSIVHPVAAPLSAILLVSDGGSNQNVMLFIRGNAISGAPNVNCMKPPIIIGITTGYGKLTSFLYGYIHMKKEVSVPHPV